MAVEDQPPATAPVCPACHSSRVAPGTLGSIGETVSSIDGVQVDPWKLILDYPKVWVEKRSWLCVACGLVWSRSVDLAEARHYIGAYGTEELKTRALDAAETLPRPATAHPAQERDLPLPCDGGDRRSEQVAAPVDARGDEATGT